MNVREKRKEALIALEAANYPMACLEADRLCQSLYIVDHIEELYKQCGWKCIADSLDTMRKIRKLYCEYGKKAMEEFYLKLELILVEWSAFNMTFEDVIKFRNYLTCTK